VLTGYDEFAGYVDYVTGALGQYTTDILEHFPADLNRLGIPKGLKF
jgi:phytoene/squalene synthetase